MLKRDITPTTLKRKVLLTYFLFTLVSFMMSTILPTVVPGPSTSFLPLLVSAYFSRRSTNVFLIVPLRDVSASFSFFGFFGISFIALTAILDSLSFLFKLLIRLVTAVIKRRAPATNHPPIFAIFNCIRGDKPTSSPSFSSIRHA